MRSFDWKQHIVIDDGAWDVGSVDLPPARVCFPMFWLNTVTFWVPDDELNAPEDATGGVRSSESELTVQGGRRGWGHVAAGAANNWPGNSYYFPLK